MFLRPMLAEAVHTRRRYWLLPQVVEWAPYFDAKLLPLEKKCYTLGAAEIFRHRHKPSARIKHIQGSFEVFSTR